MKMTERIAALVFGTIFVLLSLMVTLETLLRKLFGASLQGVDELGGYALATGSTIAFTLALLDRNHIRIDLIHARLGACWKTALNLVATLLMALLAGLLCWMAWIQVSETLDYGSTAQTPWATPLIYPQAVWFGGLLLFALCATGRAFAAGRLLLRARVAEFNQSFGPRGLDEELRQELEDVARRRALAGVATASPETRELAS
ncbi:TRAP transporter small permease subunit [Marinobacterium rhizophilum]|uniref:TRAP transporter small permease protein n=1 Tax=Marinobacterium rhizophilum TaxID=420402 RepID=A0ABY5HGX2_9GAMM|nr:TRAP transporter small permease [Marinobacterium rhizophilum]UTW11607.1 TRAP transporter small permease [Marinobacterium rhizophilum]